MRGLSLRDRGRSRHRGARVDARTRRRSRDRVDAGRPARSHVSDPGGLGAIPGRGRREPFYSGAIYAGRSTSADCPHLHEFMSMTMDERWILRSSCSTRFTGFGGEGFDFIVDDLVNMPVDRGVIVEGFRLLPRLVEPLLAERRRAVWLLPPPEFRRSAFTSRGSSWDIAHRTNDPARALGKPARTRSHVHRTASRRITPV